MSLAFLKLAPSLSCFFCKFVTEQKKSILYTHLEMSMLDFSKGEREDVGASEALPLLNTLNTQLPLLKHFYLQMSRSHTALEVISKQKQG